MRIDAPEGLQAEARQIDANTCFVFEERRGGMDRDPPILRS